MPEFAVSVCRDIDAPASAIFALLCRPADHPSVDGTGMLRTTESDQVISQVGDVFVMNMFNDDMGDYVMENHVVEFEPDRRITWEPVMKAIEKDDFKGDIGNPGRHQWGWRLEPIAGAGTRVTECFDCSRSPADLQKVLRGGERWRPDMEASLENLARLVGGR
ncbi:MAG TPA: SRPBCC family protein [Acidimicrobiales bacterium]|nr:SRPBCC family protein [Acidimicrobiales bacterium]